MEEMVRALRGLNKLSLENKIDDKVGKVVDSVDVNKIIASDTFNNLLATALACRAVGIEFHNN